MGDGRERDEEGRFADRKDPLRIVDLIADRDDVCEPVTATEVADALGWARRTALNKLNELANQQVLASKKVGGRARVWWLHRLVRAPYHRLRSAETVSQQALVDAATDARPDGLAGDGERGSADATDRAFWQQVLEPALTALGMIPAEGHRQFCLDQTRDSS